MNRKRLTKYFSVLCFFILTQGPIYSLDQSDSGYATAGKDGLVKLWDLDLKLITSVNLATSSVGYTGITHVNGLRTPFLFTQNAKHTPFKKNLRAFILT